ncbi:MAG: S24 family peptidase [Succinivibrio sp.]
MENTQKKETEFDRLSSVIKEQGKSPAEISEILNISLNTVYSWFSGYRELNGIREKNRKRICECFGISYKWLRFGSGEKYLKGEETGIESQNKLSGVVCVQKCELSLGVGLTNNPTFNEIENSSPVPYRKDLFEKLNVNPKNCKIVKAKGDSMSPMIDDGDDVMIDTVPVHDVINNYVYALVTRSGLTIKKIVHNKNKKQVILISVNQDISKNTTLTESDFRNEVFFIYRVLRVEKNMI